MSDANLKPFVSDGCSGGMSWAWRFFTGKPPPWEDDCIEHDRAYWAGGTYRDRLTADRKLLWRVTAKGYPRLAWLMYQGVRLGGAAILPFPWRWGYGWR